MLVGATRTWFDHTPATSPHTGDNAPPAAAVTEPLLQQAKGAVVLTPHDIIAVGFGGQASYLSFTFPNEHESNGPELWQPRPSVHSNNLEPRQLTAFFATSDRSTGTSELAAIAPISFLARCRAQLLHIDRRPPYPAYTLPRDSSPPAMVVAISTCGRDEDRGLRHAPTLALVAAKLHIARKQENMGGQGNITLVGPGRACVVRYRLTLHLATFCFSLLFSLLDGLLSKA